MAAKETIHVRRDPRTLALALAMPLVMLVLFGYGVSTDVDHLRLMVSDQDQGAASRALVRAFQGSGEFELVTRRGPEQAEALFRRGDAVAALVVPAGFGEALSRGEEAVVQLLVDGADAMVATQLIAKAEAVVRAEGRRLAGPEAARLEPPVQVKLWTRYNPAGRSAYYLVPGISAFLLAITAVMLTALAIAGEWERGSMEQLFASPVGRLEIVLGKLLPYLALGMLELQLVVAFGAVAFDLPMRGSLPLLFLTGLLFLVGMLGQGLLISVLAKNQLVATQAGTLSAMLPSIILSGMIFPIENMPLPLQTVSRLIPARYLVHALRGILLKGNGLAELWPDLLALAVFAVAIVGLATARFKRRVA
ncbi:MAG: ABC transporter permease [Anaeromyxobacter sp.]|nr:ABC transporter permease [Anaeromyxobacter sp.]MBL0276358.1 ABC transporter permease [Anaeromyxobacter sp.]